MKLRVITPTRGGSEFWREAIESVARAAPTADHVVICPGSSRTMEDGKLRIIAERGNGLYAALNQGAEFSDSWDAFTWVNDDDRLLTPGFARLIARMAANPHVGVCYGRVELIDGKSRRIGSLPVARRPQDLQPLLARGIVPFAQPGTIIRRAVWEKIGGFDETYRSAGDLDFFVRAILAATQFAFVDAEVASFRLHGRQLSKRRTEVEAETLRVLEPLAGTPGSWSAWCRFRLNNLGVYFDRMRRHGFVSMRRLYDRTA